MENIIDISRFYKFADKDSFVICNEPEAKEEVLPEGIAFADYEILPAKTNMRQLVLQNVNIEDIRIRKKRKAKLFNRSTKEEEKALKLARKKVTKVLSKALQEEYELSLQLMQEEYDAREDRYQKQVKAEEDEMFKYYRPEHPELYPENTEEYDVILDITPATEENQ